MRIKLVVISILFLLFAIIASQNTISTELKFLFWSLQAPLIVMIVVIFILGLVIGLTFCSFYERKKRREKADNQAKTSESSKPSDLNQMK